MKTLSLTLRRFPFTSSLLLALLFGAKVAGVPGVFFAVPVAVMITAVLQETQFVGHEPESVSRQPLAVSDQP